MIPYCKATGVGLIPWSPLARGALTRPHNSRGTVREKTDGYLQSLVRSRESESDEVVIKKIEEISKKLGVSMAMIATAWVLGKGVIPILGLNSKERMEEAVKSLAVKLDEEDIKYTTSPCLVRVDGLIGVTLGNSRSRMFQGR